MPEQLQREVCNNLSACLTCSSCCTTDLYSSFSLIFLVKKGMQCASNNLAARDGKTSVNYRLICLFMKFIIFISLDFIFRITEGRCFPSITMTAVV